MGSSRFVFGRDAKTFSTKKITILKNISQLDIAGYSEYGNEPADPPPKKKKNCTDFSTASDIVSFLRTTLFHGVSSVDLLT
jgi:hypothetical protein